MKVSLFVIVFFTIVYGVYSESLCSQMGGNCNSYYEFCRTGKYSYENRFCARYGKPPMCCFYDYWDNDCIRRGGSCFDIRYSTCTNGRMVNDGCGGEHKYCCAPNYRYKYHQRSPYNPQYYNSQAKSYPYSGANLYQHHTSYNLNPFYSNKLTRSTYFG